MNTSYFTRTGRNTAALSEAHRRMLCEGSGISLEVLAERGVRTVKKGPGELPGVYSWRQKRRAPGALFTVHRPRGKTATIFRPDEPDPKNPGHKYEQECKHLGGSGNVLDVHPGQRGLDDVGVPTLFTEGIKKEDSIVTAARAAGEDLLVVGISGVWNWLSEGEPIPDMYEIPVGGREVFICFDSDMLRKPEVLMAAERLAEWLAARGAEVLVVYLPDQPDGSKTGADDFLAAGGTLEELLALARPFDPEDLRREKLSRSEKLRRAHGFVTRRGEEMPAKSRRDCSKLAAWRACETLAEKRGKLVEDGIEVRVPALTGAEIAGMSQPTFSRCMRDLAEDGLLRRIERERSEQALSYVLLVPRGVFLYKDGGGEGAGEQAEEAREDGSHRGYNVIPPLDELRWSKPGRKARRGVAEGTRKVREGRALSGDVLPVRRPGKKRLEIVRYLLSRGGAATREELLERFGSPKTAWRDFKRQTLADLLGRRRQYRGEQLSVGPPIIELDGDGIHLVEGWREALKEHRTLGEEEQAAIDQKVDHLRQRAGYRARHDNPPDHHPANAGAHGWAEELEPAPPEEQEEAAAEDATPLSPLADAIRDYLERHPRDADQPPGWLGVTVWSEGLHPKLENPAAEARAALEELGGEAYRIELLGGSVV